MWEAEQVEQLLTDVLTEKSDAPPGKAPEYFIGSIVVCPGENGVLDLIDGQQRMTTLFLILCAVRDHLKAAAASVPASLGPQIASTSTNELGQDVFRYPLDLQYEDSGGVIERIASPDADGQIPANQRSRT